MQALPLIQKHSYWIPGNEKLINIWTDKIMSEEPLGEVQELSEL